ncbi:TOPRIM nucleotidyl transferase/hydrolase domain-containing protein, partial [Methylobacterium thuringiense]|uniref:TOPRIM nucleotidyl transferase/hydrolase domain-containing protein n=1 Tax=Methylobacterium thuringiense TaxID=1003091 RepID=UPI003571278E
LSPPYTAKTVGVREDIQGTIRLYPEAFLAPSIIVCEGASEVGLLRGMDLHRAGSGEQSITAAGIAWVDAKGITQVYGRAAAFQTLGYRVAVLRDDDVQPDAAEEAAFRANGGAVFRWRDGCALEDEMFRCLSGAAVGKLLERAVELLDADLVDDHIRSASNGQHTHATCVFGLSPQTRETLGKAARSKKGSWFKSVTKMEEVARDIVFPNLATADETFRNTISAIQQWMFRGP